MTACSCSSKLLIPHCLLGVDRVGNRITIRNSSIVAQLFARLQQLPVLQDHNISIYSRTLPSQEPASAFACPEHDGPFLLLGPRYTGYLTSFDPGGHRAANLPIRRRGSAAGQELEAAQSRENSVRNNIFITETVGTMDPAQTLNRDALARLLANLANARTPGLVAQVLQQAFADKHVFAFAELYAKPVVQALKDTEHAVWVNILEIFMWGKYEHYRELKANKSAECPQLDVAAELKLRQLTIVSLASELPAPAESQNYGGNTLSISDVRRKLFLDNDGEVGYIFRTARENKLLDGTIDGANKLLLIKGIFPVRDLHPNEIGEMNGLLKVWIERAEKELAQLNKSSKDIQDSAVARRDAEADEADKLEAAIADSNSNINASTNNKNNRKRGGASGIEDLDPVVGSSRNTRQQR